MKTLLKLFIFFLLTLGTLTNCSKYGNDNNNNTPPVRYACPQEVKDYCYFKKGTYWIYEDSATKVHDSVWVYKSTFTTDTLYDPNQTNKKVSVVDNFWIETKSSYDGYEYDYYYQGEDARLCIKYDASKGKGCNRVTINKVGPSDVYGHKTLFFYTYESGVHSDFDNDHGTTTSTVIGVYNNVKIGDSTYPVICQIETTNDFIFNYNKTHFYSAPKVGLVCKKVVNSSTKWILIRSNIIQ